MKTWIAVIIVSIAPFARAWNDTGHMAVALIAYRQLSDAHRAQVNDLLKQHPHYEQFLAQGREEGVNAEEWAFLRGAFWSDWVRPARPGSPEEKYKTPAVTRFHNGEWHYITLPWVPPAYRAVLNPTTLPSRTEPNVLNALDINTTLLANKNAPPAERAVAITWIEHCIGDMHQPLHACTMFSPDYPTGDRGGNEICVLSNGAVLRLHQIWDECLGNSDSYRAVVFLVDQIISDPLLADEKLTELQNARTFESWALESHDWAIALSHLNGRLRHASMPKFDRREITVADIPSLPASYYGNMRELSKRRVALAGRRLAATIAKALDEAK
jgi:hypothetical protein